MEDAPPSVVAAMDERDDSKRKTRNASEKKRRDQFNILITELGSMVSLPGASAANGDNASRKMDKTTVLKTTIAFLRQHRESSARSHLHEIQEDWKPSFLTNEEFTHLMLESLEGFILVFGTGDGGVIYASESVTSLLGYLPSEIANMSIYEIVSEHDKPSLYAALTEASNRDLTADENGGGAEGEEVEFVLHMKQGGLQRMTAEEEEDERRDEHRNGESLSDEEEDDAAKGPIYELVKLTGYYRKWTVPIDGGGGGGGTDGEGGAQSDDDNISCKSGLSRFSAGGGVVNTAAAAGGTVGTAGGADTPDNRPLTATKVVFVCTARLQTTGLLREIPLVHAPASPNGADRNEFTSRYSLEWKFLYLDHRAPQIIGYLPFELLGTSGYDYYHFDDLDRITRCHEALMQTGEGTSCYHRFLSKGQQWIWLQTRYFITYHQWSSKPEFVVATHKVVNYTDVLRDLRNHGRFNSAAGAGAVADDHSEAGSSAAATDNKASQHYPTTDSPTWSSRSSICGGGGSSTGTRVSDGRQQKTSFQSYNDGASSGGGGGADDFYPGSEFDCISQFIHGGTSRRVRRQQQQQRRQQQQQQVLDSSPSFQIPDNAQQQQQQQQQPRMVAISSSSVTVPPHQPIFIAAAGPSGAAVPVAASAAADFPLRSQVAMTPAQLQLQEQLRGKHAELTKKIAEQQEELRRISEQLLMSQYGLVPVGLNYSVNSINGVSSNRAVASGQQQQQQQYLQQQQQSVEGVVSVPAALQGQSQQCMAFPAAVGGGGGVDEGGNTSASRRQQQQRNANLLYGGDVPEADQ